MLRLYFGKLFKEYLALKLLFGFLTFILVLQEFRVYFFEKPTYTSVSKADLSIYISIYLIRNGPFNILQTLLTTLI